jgi:hypothetical protein
MILPKNIFKSNFLKQVDLQSLSLNRVSDAKILIEEEPDSKL